MTQAEAFKGHQIKIALKTLYKGYTFKINFGVSIVMKQGRGKSIKALLTLTTMLYGVYLLKTLLGINVLNHYSAPWVLKVPLEPLLSHKTELCTEFQTLCILRSKIFHAIQPRIEKAKRAV
jgi:hypothetical protein